MSEFAQPSSRVAGALKPFRASLEKLHFPLAMSGTEDCLLTYTDVVNQLDDYVIPRYESLEAPLLAVFGGSTGAGKSTLVNSVLGDVVALSSAIRPTTRRPLLLHHPDDADWFTDQRIFPNLARVTSHGPNELSTTGEAGSELEIRSTTLVPRGMALLDSPDIDSVVVENRQLAAQFLAAADMWVFVTTAARYGDAIPWAMLDEAAERNVVVGIILNRVPAGTGAEVRADFDRMLGERGLEHAPLFVLSEQKLTEEGLVAAEDVAPIRGWLEGLASDAQVRSSVARQTLSGTVDKLVDNSADILEGYDEQLTGIDSLRWDVNAAFDRGLTNITRDVSDGSMLRGEVLARWQDVVGTGEWSRKLEHGVSTLRDKISGFFRASVDTSTVEEAIEDNLQTLIAAESEAANARVRDAWSHGIAQTLVGATDALRSDEERTQEAARLVRQWQTSLIAMIRNEGESKRLAARALAFSVNAIGVALIIVVFASTGGLVGGEIAVAGGTAVVAQRLLEAVFGDGAVRRMAKEAKANLEQMVKDYLDKDRHVWEAAIDEVGLSREIRDEYAQNLRALTEAKIADGRNL
ncbi:dynamin family protein [Trueperella pecoris]|uniref:Dynamin family protein n=1 Tax=Trueperella pecoris TaxID=2733571 RepID=A0A7M1R303_9ACTO|nr:dynamin family protein [Trueperella pecoris]QOR48568.1 dynamin family protein [Trueperella pecoris]